MRAFLFKFNIFKKAPIYFKFIVLGIILIVCIIVLKNKNYSASPSIIYVKDGKLQFLSLEDKKPYTITTKFFESPEYIDNLQYIYRENCIFASENKDIIYYPDNPNNGSYTYKLLDLNLEKNIANCFTKIDTEIFDSPKISKDGNYFFYKRGSHSDFYVYIKNLKEKIKLDSEVLNFYINDSGNYILYQKYSDNEYSIYEATFEDTSFKKNRIDSNAFINEAYPNTQEVYYLKENTLYLKKRQKEKQKISSQIYEVRLISNDHSLYYTKNESVVKKLSYFVEDDLLSSDANISEPLSPEYPEPPIFPNEFDYTYEEWFDQEAYSEAHSKYTNDYIKWEEECINLQNAYDTSFTNYHRKLIRDKVRELLETDSNAITYEKKSLYYWKNGKETLVSSDIAYANPVTSNNLAAIEYRKYNAPIFKGKKLSRLMQNNYDNYEVMLEDLKNKISDFIHGSNRNYIIFEGKENAVEYSNSSQFLLWDNTLYFLDLVDFRNRAGNLMKANIQNNTILKAEIMDTDVMIIDHPFESEDIFYYKNLKDGLSSLFWNQQLISDKVKIFNFIKLNESNTFVYLKNYDWRSQSGDFSINQNNLETLIANRVNSYHVFDEKNIVYLGNYKNKKGDFMLYDGSTSIKIDSEVKAFVWSSE